MRAKLGATIVLPALGLLLGPQQHAFAAGGPRPGQRIEITGVVTDAQGVPIPEVSVILEAFRKSFHLRKMEWQRQGKRRVSAVTDAGGKYSLQWTWHNYYNRFELQVAVAVRQPDEVERLEILSRTDLSHRMKQGSPVVAPLAVEDTRFLASLREFVASVKSPDERRVYGAMGQPDKVDIVHYENHSEVSWWYFSLGQAYRFDDGRLMKVDRFDPVPPG